MAGVPMSGRPDSFMPGTWVMCSPEFAPVAAGVYAIYVNGELVYVGSSKNLRQRLAQHNVRYGYSPSVITPWGQFHHADASYHCKVKVSRRYGEWAMLELRLIRRLKPRCNTRHVDRKAVAS
jgi:excinuclease UvrABC nuclease subunit